MGPTSLKVLIFGNLTSPHVRRWVSELEKRGVATVSLSFTPPPADFTGRYELVTGSFPWNLRNGVRACKRLLRDEKIDLLHAHYIGSYGILAALTGFRPLVESAWGSDLLVTARRNFITRWIFRRTLRRASVVFADSQELLSVAREIGGADLKTEHVLWGVDQSLIGQPKRFTEKKARHFFSARMHEPLYNLETVLRAFASARVPEARLELAGFGSQTDTLKALATSLKIADRVEFTGWREEAQMAESLARADVAVSVPSSDGTAMSVLEAMAAGLPLIASDIGANREWLGAGGGILVAGDNAEAIAGAFESFYKGEFDLEAMSFRNSSVVEARASRTDQFDRVVQIYKALLSDR